MGNKRKKYLVLWGYYIRNFLKHLLELDFLDDVGNEYTAIVFKTEQVQDYILINTDVNDEFYQGWKGTTVLNLFSVMNFERYRTRIIEKGQMELVNLSKAELKNQEKGGLYLMLEANVL
ncbi:hypothetical protein MXZ36_10050 [Streptococcus uberis]|nr:hypothetical protein [Streptococcus uberis]